MAFYRMIYEASPGVFDTGTNYLGCNRLTAPEMCQPVQFAVLEDAIKYAEDHNEVPIRVTSLEEIDAIIAGTKQVTNDMILSSGFLSNIPIPVIIGGAVLLFMVIKPKRHAK